MARRPATPWIVGRFLAALATVWIFSSATASAALPPEVARRIDAAIVDLVRGRAADAHEKLQPLLEVGAPAQHQEIEAILKRYKIQDSLGPLLASLRIDVTMAQGARPAKSLKPMGSVEAGYVLPAVDAKLKSLLEPIDKELAIGFRVDAATEALEEQLVRCTGLVDQMDVVDRLQALQNDASRLARAKGAKPAPKKDVAQHKTRRDQLVSRIVEIAITLIPDQLQVLRDDGAEYSLRAKASARLEDAFAVAKMYFPKYRGVKKSAGKSVGGKSVGQQDAALKEQEREFDKLAGPLRLKIYHLEQGKQWWLRGRWGVGPYHDGQTKAASGRATLDAFLFYPLLLPDPFPKPLNPLKDARPLPVGRRHLEVWKAAFPAGQAYARAERNFRISNQTWKLMLPPPGQPSVNYNRLVESDDEFNPFVGYLEYQMALYHWGRLLGLANESELKGLEKSIAEDDRFIVPSYLSRQYDSIDPNSTLKLTPPKSDDPRASDVYERRGLSWCIALAQIEVAGVKAVYTGLEYEPKAIGDAPPAVGAMGGKMVKMDPTGLPPVAAIPVRRSRTLRPFDRVTPTPFTQRAIAELLWDGMRQQYYRVKAEVVLNNSEVSLPNEYLAPVVRLAVALEFVRAYRQKFASTLTSAQLDELRSWQTEIERRLSQLVGAWSNALRWAMNLQAGRNMDIGTATRTPASTGTGIGTPPGMTPPPGGTKNPPGGTTTPGKGGKSAPSGGQGPNSKKENRG
jgi:hypothetical protein